MSADHTPVSIQCFTCDEDREVVLERWEYEMGDFGSVLSSWPVFSVSPPCPGVKWNWAEDEELTPANCPFHPAYENVPCQVQETVMAVIRDRKKRVTA